MDDDGWIGRWSPGIGDPTIGGWVTVAAYALASVLCWLAAGRAVREPRPRAWHWRALRHAFGSLRPWRLDAARHERLAALWMALAAAMALLAVNKQLDLQTAFTEVGRHVAFTQGWYQSRRPVQAAFVLAVGVALLWALRALVGLTRGARSETRLALAGSVFLGAFVVARAASFHHMDRLIGIRLLGLRMNWVLEIGGIFLVAVGALWFRARSPEAALDRGA